MEKNGPTANVYLHIMANFAFAELLYGAGLGQNIENNIYDSKLFSDLNIAMTQCYLTCKNSATNKLKKK